MSTGFPVLGSKPKQYVPWDFVVQFEAQAQKNHSQTLKRLAERGGLSWTELKWIIRGVGWNAGPALASDNEYVERKIAEWQNTQIEGGKPHE